MRIEDTELEGVCLVQTEPAYDERGFFARTFDRDAFLAVGLDGEVAEASLSSSRTLGTLRGLHWRAAPSPQTLLVRVVRGRIFDVVVDLRPRSPTFGRWQGWELSDRDGRAVYVPAQCAHGLMTLDDDVEILFQSSEPHRPELVRRLRWDDPDLAIEWPLAPRVIAPADVEAASWLADISRRPKVA